MGLPDRSKVSSSLELLGFPVRISERVWPADLIVMELQHKDIILGMDWMRQHGAVIDLRTHTMTLTTSDGSRYEVWVADPKRNDLLISAVRAARLIDQGCVRYWCYAIMTEASKAPSMEEMPVVRDFLRCVPY